MKTFVYIDDDTYHKELVRRAVEQELATLIREDISFRFLTISGQGPGGVDASGALFLDEEGQVIDDPGAEGSPVQEVMPGQVLRQSELGGLLGNAECFFLIDVDFLHPQLKSYGVNLALYLKTRGVPKERILLFTAYADRARQRFPRLASAPWFHMHGKAGFRVDDSAAAHVLAVELHGFILNAERAMQERLGRGSPPTEGELAVRLSALRGKLSKCDGIIGRSSAIFDVLDSVRQVCQADATVLLRGESGTGKELIAHAIHYNSSRAENAFIGVHCGALPDTIIESELFGHEKGAFTGAISQRQGRFELARGGTLFLDEIGDITPATQVKLLRVLQEKEFERVGGTETLKTDVRLIAATNRHLEELIADGKFREDLYYRLNVFPIDLPPLRERQADIILLAMHFSSLYAKQNKREIAGIASSAVGKLTAYRWPGNIRELANCIERAVLVAAGKEIVVANLPPEVQSAEANTHPSEGGPSSGSTVEWKRAEEDVVDFAKRVSGPRFQGKQFPASLLVVVRKANSGDQDAGSLLRRLLITIVGEVRNFPDSARREVNLARVVRLLGRFDTLPGWLTRRTESGTELTTQWDNIYELDPRGISRTWKKGYRNATGTDPQAEFLQAVQRTEERKGGHIHG